MKTHSRSRFAMVALVLGLALPGTALAHIKLIEPPPRSDDNGLKTAPCGNIPRTDTPMVFKVGQTIAVTWEETIDHPGWFRIAFSPSGDTGFDDHVLADNIGDAEGGGCYQKTVTLPDIPCTDCTLQLIQVMTDKPQEDGDYQKYYSCADIVLEEGVPSGDPPTGEGDGHLESCPGDSGDGGGACGRSAGSMVGASGGLVALAGLAEIVRRRARRKD